MAPDQQATLFVHTTAGAEREVALAIRGIVRTGSSFADAYAIYVPLRFARQILDTDGVHRLLLYLHHERDLDAAQERLHRRISETGLPLSVSNWREVQEFYDQLKSFYDLLFRFAIVVVTLLSMVAIFAMISVSFLERLRELGSLRAIGTTRGQLLLLLVESLTTYLLGAAAALGLGLAAGAAINALDITFVPIGSNLAAPFYIDLEVRYFLVPAVITLVMTGAATLVPTLRTARLSIASVLRHD